jgi:hypothetical protein
MRAKVQSQMMGALLGLAGLGVAASVAAAAQDGATRSERLERGVAAAGPADSGDVVIETAHLRYVIGPDGRSRHFFDKRTGVNYCDGNGEVPFARIRIGGKEIPATAAARQGDGILVRFGEGDASAMLKLEEHDEYFTLSVRFAGVHPPLADPAQRRAVVPQAQDAAEVGGAAAGEIEEFVFIDVPLALKGSPDEPFAACALALNLRTRVHELPGHNARLRAMCYPRFGMRGAAVAIVGCPPERLREVIQQVVTAAPELPKSPLGGPWALDAPINQGSYLFNFGGLSEETVDDWIRVARQVGVNQIDFHGGHSFRFGDLRPNPETYPRGRASLKAVIDKLHAAGIKAGLHTYAFFLAKDSEWVSPVPDPRLAKFATFTLAEDLTAEAPAVPVLESTENISTITGFFVWNSVTIQIDDELITFSGVSKEPPYAFTQVQRGAWGTRAAPHAKGAKVHHLKECFGLFLPDGESTLFAQVAARTAEMFNECGFDMMYLDALDGEGIIGGPEAGWHYGAKFVYEIMSRLERPALMEMSTFHHHLWYVRSRYCAWDHPNRGHKRFIDIHVASNNDNRRIFMPGHLGWWAVKTWGGHQQEPTFADDIEYLMAKCLGTDTGFSIMHINPDTIRQVPAYERLAGIMRQYEELRHGNYFSEEVKARLRAPNAEFTLVEDGAGGWTFRPVHRHKHKVSGSDERSRAWRVNNPFGRQPARLRIEALLSAGPYDDPSNPVLADFADVTAFSDRQAAPGMTVDLAGTSSEVKVGEISGRFTAGRAASTDGGPSAGAAQPGAAGPQPSWAKVARTYAPPLDLSGHQGLGVWVHGDGGGQVLNLQVQSPHHITRGIGEHYIDIDFEGWRYFELVELEGDRCAEFAWPYSWHYYALYREHVDYKAIETLGLWYNNVPPDRAVTCHISPIRAIPLVNAKLVNPAVTIGGRTITFPVAIETGSYLEFTPPDDARVYGPQGELVARVTPEGEAPRLNEGHNEIRFDWAAGDGPHPRVQVSVIAQGEPLDR